MLDSRGILHTGRDDMNIVKADLARSTNPRGLTGGMVEALDGADVFLGVSAGVVPEELIATMAPDGIVFALSNPDPEIHPDVAAKYAAVVATGRSDFPNQINNVLAFPGVFRGALDAGARRITEKMMVAAAEAIFSVVSDDLAPDRIVPEPAGPARRGGGGRRRWLGCRQPRSDEAGRLAAPLLAAALAVAGCAACTERPSRRARVGGRIRPRRRVDAAGRRLRRGAAVLRFRRAQPRPPTTRWRELDSGAFTVVPAFTGQVLQTLQPGASALSDAQVYRAMVVGAARGRRPRATTPRPPKTNPCCW